MIDYSKVNAHICDRHVIGIFYAGGEGEGALTRETVLDAQGKPLPVGYYYASTDTFGTPAAPAYQPNKVDDWHVVCGPFDSHVAAVEALLADLQSA